MLLLASLIIGASLGLGQPAKATAQAPAPEAAHERKRATGKVFLTKEEALALAFKDCDVERSTVYLSAAQRERVDELAGFKVKTSIAYTYVATKQGKPMGCAWFDVSKVRSKKQLVMFVVGTDNRIKRFELLAFAEPVEYIPRANWYAQFIGKRLDKDLKLKKDIKSVTGATLTARATVQAARRVLALHHTIFPAADVTRHGQVAGSPQAGE